MVEAVVGSSQDYCLSLAVENFRIVVADKHKKTARRRFLCVELKSDEAASLIIRLLDCGDVALTQPDHPKPS